MLGREVYVHQGAVLTQRSQYIKADPVSLLTKIPLEFSVSSISHRSARTRLLADAAFVISTV